MVPASGASTGRPWPTPRSWSSWAGAWRSSPAKGANWWSCWPWASRSSIDEIAALSSEEILIAAEADGLVALSGGEVRLAHPLYGEAVRAALPPLRGRGLRLRLVEALRSRAPLGPDDSLRVARLLLDSGASLSADLALDAAQAANHAGDPDLGAQLADLAGAPGDVAAAMLLAQAHSMRNRYEDADAALAAVESLVAASPTRP